MSEKVYNKTFANVEERIKEERIAKPYKLVNKENETAVDEDTPVAEQSYFRR